MLLTTLLFIYPILSYSYILYIRSYSTCPEQPIKKELVIKTLGREIQVKILQKSDFYFYRSCYCTGNCQNSWISSGEWIQLPYVPHPPRKRNLFPEKLSYLLPHLPNKIFFHTRLQEPHTWRPHMAHPKKKNYPQNFLY